MSTNVVEQIKKTADGVYQKIIQGNKPTMKLPIRALNNVRYSPEEGYLQMQNKNKVRTLTVNTVKSFAQTLRMMALSKEMVENDKHATKREAYYISKNWEEAKFLEQPESDAVMDDIEAMLEVTREHMRFRPEEHGGAVAGRLIVVDRDRKTKEKIEIDCSRLGSGAYTVPSSVEHLGFRTKAKFVLAIETGGMFDRLVEEGFSDDFNCIMISMGGVPSRACRRFIRRLADEHKIPVYAFTDGDPYGYMNIYRTLKVGSGNAAHLNQFFCVPQARYLGVTPQDIIDYKLTTHELKEQDVKRALDAIKNDPFVQHYKSWQKALEQMLKMKQRVEQQAFAKHSLEFVAKTYLPNKLKNPEKFLP
ncbi:MAG: DNA topoisomerase IV subunit A [Phycisphaerae bacterium]